MLILIGKTDKYAPSIGRSCILSVMNPNRAFSLMKLYVQLLMVQYVFLSC